MSARDIQKLMSVFRTPPRTSTGAGVQADPTAFCLCCRRWKAMPDMHFIADTGIVRRVMDCLCADCELENRKELAQAARLVCAGCREVVMIREPEVESTGFSWKPGGYYHVACCPKCTNDAGLKSSSVVEKIAFYKARGIPY